MSRKTSIHYGGDPTIIAEIPGRGITEAAGDTVPTDGSTGFAVGCIFKHLDGSTGTSLYVNEGTQTSCDFNTAAAAGSGLIADAGSFTAQTTVEGALQELYQHLFSATGGYVDLPLTAWREVDSSGDVGNIVANGGVLASDTTPILMGDAAESMEINWATTVVDPIAIAIGVPPDFDGTAPCYVNLQVKGGTTNAPTFTVETGWDGAALVSDTATGSASATLHTATATIAAADVPDVPKTLTIALTPGAHATDAFLLLGASLTYKRKLLTS